MNLVKMFRRNNHRDDTGPSVIGHPTNVIHDIHVSKNKETGQLEGLPLAWQRQIGNLFTEAEQNNNPSALLYAVKYYNYSMKKKEEFEPFKHIVTEQDIHEESEAIELYMNSNAAHQSRECLNNDRHMFADIPELSNR